MFHGMLSISMFALFGTPFLGREEIVQGVAARLAYSAHPSLPSSFSLLSIREYAIFLRDL